MNRRLLTQLMDKISSPLLKGCDDFTLPPLGFCIDTGNLPGVTPTQIQRAARFFIHADRIEVTNA